MQFEKTRHLDDFLPRVQANISSADTDMVRTFIMDAVVQFCRESQLIRRVECIIPQKCIYSYALTKIKKDERLSEIISVRLFYNNLTHVNTYDYYVDDTTIYFDQLPTMPKIKVEVEYSIVPKRDSELVYDVLYEDWIDAITHLTLSKMYALTDGEWANNTLVGYHTAQYEQILRACRLHTITKHKALNIKLRPKWSK